MLAAIEVSTRISSVALLDLVTGEEVAEASLPADWESSVTLVPALEVMLRQKGVAPEELAAMAVSVGPGSFTGIRVGLATATGLCLPTNLPVFGVSTLDGLAENLRVGGLHGKTLALIDAQRDQCFVGSYDIGMDDFTETAPPQIRGVGELDSLLKERAWIVGPGALKYEKEIRQNLGTLAMFAFSSLHSPKAISVARVAYRQWQTGLRPTLTQLKPLYLRPPAVEEKKSPQ